MQSKQIRCVQAVQPPNRAKPIPTIIKQQGALRIDIQKGKRYAIGMVLGYGEKYSFNDIFTTCSIQSISLMLLENVFCEKEYEFNSQGWPMFEQFIRAFCDQLQELDHVFQVDDKGNKNHMYLTLANQRA